MLRWASPKSAARRGLSQIKISDVSGSLSNRGAAFFRLAAFLPQRFEREGWTQQSLVWELGTAYRRPREPHALAGRSIGESGYSGDVDLLATSGWTCRWLDKSLLLLNFYASSGRWFAVSRPERRGASRRWNSETAWTLSDPTGISFQRGDDLSLSPLQKFRKKESPWIG